LGNRHPAVECDARDRRRILAAPRRPSKIIAAGGRENAQGSGFPVEDLNGTLA